MPLTPQEEKALDHAVTLTAGLLASGNLDTSMYTPRNGETTEDDRITHKENVRNLVFLMYEVAQEVREKISNP